MAPDTAAVRMRWERGRYSTIYGYAGGLNAAIASIGWSTQRNDPEPHRLRTDLPGFTAERGYATEDEAKAAAARIVSRFIAKITEGAEGV